MRAGSQQASPWAPNYIEGCGELPGAVGNQGAVVVVE